jgi:tRNA pseudouridine55 synthase
MTESTASPVASEGLVVVDKPGGWTSHDVVAKVRGLAGTRKVGHAGTLDPMATGVLVVGIGRATRLLGYLAANDKEYLATIRLGAVTTTDDAEGSVVSEADASGVSDDAVGGAIQKLTGDIEQVPSAVSAVKVDGVRAYKRVRQGEAPDLAARQVTVSVFELLTRRGTEVDVRVVCSSGTYVRALARDVGAALGVGAHLTSLRRTRVGAIAIDDARTLDQLAETFSVKPLADVVAAMFPRWDVDADTARRIAHGQQVPIPGVTGPTGVFGPNGDVVALIDARDDGTSKSLVGFVAG